MTIGRTPICYSCKHRDLENAAGMTCMAFPEEIPDEIVMGENDHSKPLKGQEGDFVFEERDDTSNI